jgi:glycosyltransferase involved in cell wall biosynthesis
MDMPSCTCVIPFFNEENRILSVLRELLKVEEFDEFILVNDWSTDNWGSLVKDFIKDLKRVKLVEYPQNHWKSYAVKIWLSKVKSDYVFFFDADLQWVKKDEVWRVIKSLYKYPEIDTWILRRIYTKRFVRIFMTDLLLSGQRMLKTTDAKKIFEWKMSGYQMEIAINTYMYNHKKLWVRYPFSAENTFKKEKYWALKWFIREFNMYKNIFRYKGFFEYVKISACLWLKMIKSYKQYEN